MARGDRGAVRTAARIGLIVWTAYSVAGIVALGASFATTPAELDTGGRPLSLLGALVRPHERCPLCDMTHAFCALSHGELELALAYNGASPAWYAAAWLLVLSAVPCAMAWRRLFGGGADTRG